MNAGNYPKGAGLGRDPNPRNPMLIDFEWAIRHGSRAQRREILRLLKMQIRQGVPGAAEALRTLAGMSRSHRMWRVSLPGRAPFTVFCAQGATAAEIRQQWPGAALEVSRGQ